MNAQIFEITNALYSYHASQEHEVKRPQLDERARSICTVLDDPELLVVDAIESVTTMLEPSEVHWGIEDEQERERAAVDAIRAWMLTRRKR